MEFLGKVTEVTYVTARNGDSNQVRIFVTALGMDLPSVVPEEVCDVSRVR